MKLPNLILLFLVSILMMGCTLSTGDEACVSDAPERVGKVPDSAKWIGGCDGGQWYYIHEGYSADKFHISIYHDYNGELWKEGDFVFDEQTKYPENFNEIYDQILDFDGEEIRTSNGTLVEYIPKYKINEDWKNTDISSATLYFYAPHIENSKYKETFILVDGKLNEYVIDSMTKELKSIDVLRLKRILENELIEEDLGADTYEPYNGIVMRDSLGGIVGHISVCIPCGNYVIKPHRSNLEVDSIREIFKEYSFPIARRNIFNLAHRLYGEN